MKRKLVISLIAITLLSTACGKSENTKDSKVIENTNITENTEDDKVETPDYSKLPKASMIDKNGKWIDFNKEYVDNTDFKWGVVRPYNDTSLPEVKAVLGEAQALYSDYPDLEEILEIEKQEQQEIETDTEARNSNYNWAQGKFKIGNEELEIGITVDELIKRDWTTDLVVINVQPNKSVYLDFTKSNNTIHITATNTSDKEQLVNDCRITGYKIYSPYILYSTYKSNFNFDGVTPLTKLYDIPFKCQSYTSVDNVQFYRYLSEITDNDMYELLVYSIDGLHPTFIEFIEIGK